MKKLAYKPQIDGIRAIAVGSVVLYHSQLTILDYQIFKGGFIGVDIFFKNKKSIVFQIPTGQAIIIKT